MDGERRFVPGVATVPPTVIETGYDHFYCRQFQFPPEHERPEPFVRMWCQKIEGKPLAA